MLIENGSKQQTIKEKNRALVLQSVLNRNVISRAEIARQLDLTKTTLTNIVGGLLQDDILVECGAESAFVNGGAAQGRKSIGLGLSPKAPLICGVLVQRGSLHVVFSNLKGEFLVSRSFTYKGRITVDAFQETLAELFKDARKQCPQELLAAGISCIGPLNTVEGMMHSPHHFFTEACEFDIVSFVSGLTGVPAYLCNDATAGALAEKLYGMGREEENFLYISTFNGIGAGLFLDNKLYNGAIGQNGELGHMSINFMGPRCVCGNDGCLELYTDIDRILSGFSHFKDRYPAHPLLDGESHTILDVLTRIDEDDVLAMAVMSEYCKYLAFAVSNLITQLNLNLVILAGSHKTTSRFFEQTLEHMINEKSFMASNQKNRVVKSGFGLDSPLYGSVGIVIDKIFNGEIYPAPRSRRD